tara:strand:- start:809 stop:925 length:117 start_codon:yes stop_codon:yes gene_type:complete
LKKTIDAGYYLELAGVGPSEVSVKFNGTTFSLRYLFKK